MKYSILLLAIAFLLQGCSSGSKEGMNIGVDSDPNTLRFSACLDPPEGYSYQVPTTFGNHSGPHMILTEYPGFLVGANLIQSGSSKSHSIGAKQAAVRGLVQRLDGDGKVVNSYECDGTNLTGLAHVYGSSQNILMSGGKTVGGQSIQNGFVAYLEGESSILWEIYFPEMSAVQDIDSNTDGYVGTGTASHGTRIFRVDLEGNLLWEVNLFHGEGETTEGFPYTQTAEASAVRFCKDGTVLTVSRIYRTVTQPTGEIMKEGFGIARIKSDGSMLFVKVIMMPSSGISCVAVDAEEEAGGTYLVLTDQSDSTNQNPSYRSELYRLDADGDIINSTIISGSSHGIYSAGGLLNGRGESSSYVGVSVRTGTTEENLPKSDMHWFGLYSSDGSIGISSGRVDDIGVDNIPLSLCPDGLGGPLVFGLYCEGPTTDFPDGKYRAFLMTYW
jgi:hypothetical protein